MRGCVPGSRVREVCLSTTDAGVHSDGKGHTNKGNDPMHVEVSWLGILHSHQLITQTNIHSSFLVVIAETEVLLGIVPQWHKDLGNTAIMRI